MSNETTRLPMPEHLEPKNTKRSLQQKVGEYFYTLYNDGDTFRSWLASTGNKDAITGNRYFDLNEAVLMIIEKAKEAKDTLTTEAKKGEILKYLMREVAKNPELRLKLRRIEYKRFQKASHQLAAE